MTSMKDLAKKRQDLGISQAELALVTGMTGPGLSKIESGDVDCRESTISRINDGINTIVNNQQAKNTGVIIISELAFKNSLFQAILPELQTREKEPGITGAPHELAQELVKSIYERIAGTGE